MTMTNTGYRPRCLDDVIERHLRAFGAVEVGGTMWSGKTWTSMAHAESMTKLDSPSVIEVARADPNSALYGQTPHLIDEWQEVPAVWDAVRRSVDEQGGKRGLYLLTGSSRPLKKEEDRPHHTGAGRIARLRMWPMSLFESGDSSGEVSLAGLFDGKFEPGPEDTDLMRIAHLICRGGWPAALDLDEKDAKLIPSQYLRALIEGVQDDTSRNPDELRRLLRSLARTLGSAATQSTLAKDTSLTLSSGKPNAPALEEWLGLLKQRYVIDELKGWDAPIKSPRRLRTKPKRCFADPSLPAALLGVSPERLLSEGQTMGQLFEELCLRDLRVYASCLEGVGLEPLHYYRDSDGLEVDAIVELLDGRWGAIEIKLGVNKVPEAVRSLGRLQKKIANNPAARNPEPSFMAVIVGKTDLRYKTPEGICVFPITSLRP
ncbi:MAG: ATP-binding protein [Coriobacteriales bacterium]|jgi:predicted AAA+ superfamily ATPase